MLEHGNMDKNIDDRVRGAAQRLRENGLAVSPIALQAVLGAGHDDAIARYLTQPPTDSAADAPEARAADTALSFSDDQASAIGFSDDQALVINVTGALRGQASFVQSHTVAAAGNSAKELPTLVTGRAALVLFIPESGAPSSVKVYRTGQPQQAVQLAPPADLARSDQPPGDTRPDLHYSTRAWSGALPADWMANGLALTFEDNAARTGALPAGQIDFEAPAVLVLQNIRIGMLTDYGTDHWFEQHPAIAGLDYYQKIPVRKLIVAYYLPVMLKPIRMPNGALYTTASTDNGGVYSGDMREQIGKAMISVGINNANFGIVDSGGSLQQQPQYYQQVVVHTNVGVYANGIQQHGLSGGNGMATLVSTSGNELSHEIGHHLGLGHYPGGGGWSAHNPGSGWGYDDWRRRFIGNVKWEAAPSNTVIEGVTTPPFKGQYTFNTDPMGGGSPSGTITKLTLHTGYSAKRVQQVLSATAVLDPSSSTGYRKWNPVTKTMDIHNPGGLKPAYIGVPVVTLVGFFDPDGQFETFLCPLYGNYGQVYTLPQPSSLNGTAYLEITGGPAGTTRIALSNQRLKAGEMNKFHINLRIADLPVRASFVNRLGVRKDFDIPLPPQPMQPPVVIGGSDWEAAIVPRLPDFTRWRPLPFKVESTALLDRQLANTYGPIHSWSGTERSNRRPGELYAYDNPYNSKRQYFLLKTKSYWYFPTNSADNEHWRYLGDADRFVSHRPNPLKARGQAQAATLNDALLAYYRTTQLNVCQLGQPPGAKIGSVGALWYSESTQSYYLQRVPSASCADLPAATDNASFYFVGTKADLTALFMNPMSLDEFSRRTLAWYGIDRFREWSERGLSTVGDIFSYANPHGSWDYFVLQEPGAFYFPIDKRSHGGWIYLGSYR